MTGFVVLTHFTQVFTNWSYLADLQFVCVVPEWKMEKGVILMLNLKIQISLRLISEKGAFSSSLANVSIAVLCVL